MIGRCLKNLSISCQESTKYVEWNEIGRPFPEKTLERSSAGHALGLVVMCSTD
jgi:hypothetical protein